MKWKKQQRTDAAQTPKNAFHALTAKPADGGRVFRNGAYASAITVAALILVILVNLIVGAIPTKYTSFDISAAGLYTLDESTLSLVRALTDDVTIYYLSETGSEDAVVTNLLDRYTAESSHLSWQRKDPALYPTFAAQHDAAQASAGSLILVSGERSKLVDSVDLYQYDYTNYYTDGSYDVSFDGESQITSALYSLTSGEQSIACYTTNHSEYALGDELLSALEKQNLSVSAVNLLTENIPADCDLLIVNCPQSDFVSSETFDELGALESYLERGGKLLLLTDAGIDTPNLDALMAEYGLSRVEGLVVEGDANYHLRDYAYYLLPAFGETSECTALDGLTSSDHVFLPLAQGITATETEGVTAEALLISSDSAYSKIAGYDMQTTEKSDGDLDGPFTLAVWAEKDSDSSEVIWLGCGNMSDASIDSYIAGGNSKFLLGCAAAMTGQSSSILIASKALEGDRLTVAGGTARVLGFAFILLIPALLLAVGAIFTILRRRR